MVSRQHSYEIFAIHTLHMRRRQHKCGQSSSGDGDYALPCEVLLYSYCLKNQIH